jgi:hypothetical protein
MDQDIRDIVSHFRGRYAESTVRDALMHYDPEVLGLLLDQNPQEALKSLNLTENDIAVLRALGKRICDRIQGAQSCALEFASHSRSYSSSDRSSPAMASYGLPRPATYSPSTLLPSSFPPPHLESQQHMIQQLCAQVQQLQGQLQRSEQERVDMEVRVQQALNQQHARLQQQFEDRWQQHTLEAQRRTEALRLRLIAELSQVFEAHGAGHVFVPQAIARYDQTDLLSLLAHSPSFVFPELVDNAPLARAVQLLVQLLRRVPTATSTSTTLAMPEHQGLYC